MNQPIFKEGDEVLFRDGDGTVGVVKGLSDFKQGGFHWYRVRFNATTKPFRENQLKPFVDMEVPLEELLARDAYAGPEAFRRHVTAVKLLGKLTDVLYSYGAARTTLMPYQFVPLLKFLRSSQRRLLIADEVGLGKTIETGYIMQEEAARGGMGRTLVVCPAALRRKWQQEMSNRFGFEFEILDAGEAARRIPVPAGKSAAQLPLRAIVSLQSLRSDRFIQKVEGAHVPLDLLVLDEAHHCRNPQTKQAQAVAALMQQADAAVFLSATPIQTGSDNLFQLLHLLVPAEFPDRNTFESRLNLNQPVVDAETLLRKPGAEALKQAASRLRELQAQRARGVAADNPLLDNLIRAIEAEEDDTPARRVDLQERVGELNLLANVFTRSKRRDVMPDTAQRQAMVPEARLGEVEQEAYDAISNFVFDEYERRHGDGIARFVLVNYQRQVASCLPEAVRKFQEQAEQGSAELADDLEVDDDTGAEGVDVDAVRSASCYRPMDDPRFQELVAGLDPDLLEQEDTKYRALGDAIRNQHALHGQGERRSRKLIVFSYYRRSLDYLERRLSAEGFSLVRVDGDVNSTPNVPDTDERGKRIARFRSEAGVDVLLTSEVSSEGIDLQFCDTIVNWDLPWNPMVIEQRIGRIDRIGQQSPKIFIVNLALEGTIEARIVGRLYDRIGVFESSIGELEPILGEIVSALREDLFRPDLSPEEQERRLDARERAIANEQLKQVQLDADAAMLIGHDAVLHERLDGIQRFGRFIGGDELRLFMGHELKRVAAGLALDPTGEPGEYRLPYRPELADLVRRSLARDDPAAMAFAPRMRKGLRVHFGSLAAEPPPGTETLHAQHPLVRAVVAGMDDAEVERPAVASLQLESDALPAGSYFYLWAKVNESGFLRARSLMCVLVDLSGTSLRVEADEAGDQVLAELLTRAEPWSGFSPPNIEQSTACVRAAESRIAARTCELSERRADRMEAIRQTRLATVEATYRSRIAQQAERTAAMAARAVGGDSGAERILPAYRAKLERLEEEQDAALADVEALKLGEVTFMSLGAGFVRITEPSG